MKVETFVKNPMEIEASRYNGTAINARELVAWMGEDARYLEKEHALEIVTLEGVMTVDEGDYVIKGIKGEFYPCKPDIFAASYALADEVPENSGVVEPTEPGFYVYDGGGQTMVFLLSAPGYSHNGGWAVFADNGDTRTCDWGYIEQALGVWNLVRLDSVEFHQRKYKQIAWRINGGAEDGVIVGDKSLVEKLKNPHGGYSPIYIEDGD